MGETGQTVEGGQRVRLDCAGRLDGRERERD